MSKKNNPADKVEQWPIEKLVPYAKNSRTHSEDQIAQLAASIKEWGFTSAILVDEDGGIIAGHGRVMAARKLGLASLPVMVAAGWSEAQKRAYVIADNKLALNAGWDNELLALELAELDGLGFDVELTGFSDEEIKALMPVEVTEGLTDPDDAPAVQENPVTVPGDVWVMGKHRLLCGDSTSVDDLAKLTQGSLVDMWLTDPPYNVAYEGGTKEKLTIKNDSMGDDQFRQFLRDAYTAADTVMKPVALFEYQLLNNTKGGDQVLDSFGGSGTTLIAAEKNGRVARIMELDPKYCDVIVKRWQDFTGKIATHAETGEPFAEVTNGNNEKAKT